MMEAYWPEAGDKPGASKHAKHHSAWYNKVNKTVLSRTMKNEKREKTRFIGDNVDTEIKKLKATTGKEIMIFGSPGATHSLMALNLVDELWLFVNPVLLGKGIPMFEGSKDIKKLKLLKSHQFSSGVVCLHHEFLQND
jgi:dihydrofolate reductase